MRTRSRNKCDAIREKGIRTIVDSVVPDTHAHPRFLKLSPFCNHSDQLTDGEALRSGATVSANVRKKLRDA